MLDSGRVAEVQARLLGWYAAFGRDLPWRRTRDPYSVLIAEVMLQQTQVERVIPKWYAWLTRFPNFAALAAASRADAIREWRGLGYNLRAVRLHAIARQVMEHHAGELPRSLAGLLSLKGVGRYTAGAVACFAFGEPVAMIDTNVRRVLGRVFQASGDFERLADSLVPATDAYAWNQALMDLGATVCRAQRPTCRLCPLRDVCAAAGQFAVRRPHRIADRRASYAARERAAAEERARRGRVVDALRALPTGSTLSLGELATRVSHADSDDLESRLNRLAADGLVVIERVEAQELRLRLPD